MTNISESILGDDTMTGASKLTVAIVVEDAVMILGVLGNISLFALMRRHRFSQYSFSVYLSFSAVFDSWYLISNALLDSFQTFNHINLDSIAAKHSACIVFTMLESGSQIVCPWLVCFLTVDRFTLICYPDFGRRYCTKAKAMLVCILVSLAGFTIVAVYSIYQESYAIHQTNTTSHHCISTMPNQKAADVMYDLLCFIVPLLLVVVLSTRMLYVLRRSNGYAFVSEEGLALMNEKNRLERMNGIIFYVLVISFFTWLPFCVVEFIYIPYGTFSTIPPAIAVVLDKAWHGTLLIYMAVYAQNFYILMLLSNMFRTEFMKMVQYTRYGSSSIEPDADPAEEVVLAEYRSQRTQ